MSDTPCACGCGQDAATIERLRAERDRIAADRRDLVATLARVEALIGKWEDPGLVCDCGHDLGQHNSGGCYARLSYKPALVVCSCTETDDRYEDDFAIRDLRAALSPQNHHRSAVDAPEAPGQPGRGERGLGGDSGPCAAPSPMTGKPCQRLAGHERYAPQHWGPACGDEWEATDARA